MRVLAGIQEVVLRLNLFQFFSCWNGYVFFDRKPMNHVLDHLFTFGPHRSTMIKSTYLFCRSIFLHNGPLLRFVLLNYFLLFLSDVSRFVEPNNLSVFEDTFFLLLISIIFMG